MEDERLSRKEFLRKGFTAIAEPIALLLKRKLEGIAKRDYIRPPGAVDELSFLSLCTKCDLCKEACPHNAIKVVGPEGGLAMGTPYLNPSKSPCYLCEGLPCVKACPEGALKEVERRDVRIGIAILYKDRCLAWQGMLCDSCVTNCPFPGDAISMDSLSGPVINKESCTGCGICAFECVAKPSAIRIEPVKE